MTEQPYLTIWFDILSHDQSDQIKSNQIKFYLYGTFHTLKATQSASQRLKTAMIKHTNPPTPINTQRDTETNRHTHAHTRTHTRTHTQTHKLRPTAPIGQRHGRAPGPKARKEPPWGADHTERAPGPRPQGSPPQRQSPPGQTRGPTPRCRVLQPPGPEQSTGQHPR